MMTAPSITASDVHLWTWRFDPSVDPCDSILSPDELERAERLLFEEKRREFVTHRTNMRTILARYLEIHPAEIAFNYGPLGKPELRDFPEWRFNLSHSQGAALLGVRRGGAIGVDCESLDRAIDTSGFADLILSARERLDFETCDPARRSSHLLGIFTRKEAFMKTVGCGFSRPLSSMELHVRGDETQLVATGGPERVEAYQWHCGLLDDRLYVAVCCEESPEHPLRLTRFQD